MGSAGLSSKLKIKNPYERRLVADLAVAGMTSVVRGRFDVENLNLPDFEASELLQDPHIFSVECRSRSSF